MAVALCNGVPTYFQQRGRGPDVVLIHGLGASLAFWYLNLVPRLADRYRVTAYDLRGHGLSGMPLRRYTTRDMATDLRALMDRLDIGTAHVIGHSFGGAIALHSALAFPDRVRSVTLADTRLRSIQPVQRLRDWPQWRVWQSQLGPAAADLDPDGELDFEVWANLAQLRGPGPGQGALPVTPFTPRRGSSRALEQWRRLLATTSAADDLKTVSELTLVRIRQVAHPVELIYGEYSLCLPTARALHEHLRLRRSVIVPKAGHFFPLSKPGVFADHVRDFLDDPAAAIGSRA